MNSLSRKYNVLLFVLSVFQILQVGCFFPKGKKSLDLSENPNLNTNSLTLGINGLSHSDPLITPVVQVGSDEFHLLAVNGGVPPIVLSEISNEEVLGERILQSGFLLTPFEGPSLIVKATDSLGASVSIEVQVTAHPQVLSSEPEFNRLWGLHNEGQTYTDFESNTFDTIANNDVDAPEGWVQGTDCSGKIIAVIDTGIDLNHPDLAANLWTNVNEIPNDNIDNDGNGIIDDVRGVNFVANPNSGNPQDDNFHGTHVAGTIAGRGNNNLGVTGLCHTASIMALKILDSTGSGFLSDAADALNYARVMGAKVTNNSYGAPATSGILSSAINGANNAGVLFVAAAGNGGNDGISDDNDVTVHFPSNAPDNNVIAVASSNAFGELAASSNRGVSQVDIAAPGDHILSTFPTISTPSMTAGGFSANYEFISGTSMATPHVAAAAAHYWTENPSLTHIQVKDRLMSRARRLSNITGEVQSGMLNLKNLYIPDAQWKDHPAELGLGMYRIRDFGNANPAIAQVQFPLNSTFLPLSAGKIFDFYFTVSNIGKNPLQNAKVKFIAPAGGFITIVGVNEKTYGNLPANILLSTVKNQSIRLQIDPLVPVGESAIFFIERSWTDTATGKSHTETEGFEITF